eukprot:1068976-Rhodomonas_salina.2
MEVASVLPSTRNHSTEITSKTPKSLNRNHFQNPEITQPKSITSTISARFGLACVSLCSTLWSSACAVRCPILNPEP